MSSNTSKANFSKILVAIDGSEASMDAAEYAIEMTKKFNAELIALTVIRLPLSSYGLSSAKNELKRPKEKEEILESKQWFDNLSKKAQQENIQMKTETINSQMSIEGEIVEYAEHHDIDLIIMGTKGSSGFKKLLLGSTASGVITYATCPVMVVK